MSFKNWDRKTMRLVVKYAIQFDTEYGSKGLKDVACAVLYVKNTLSKMGVDLCQKDIDYFLRNVKGTTQIPPKPESCGREEANDNNQKSQKTSLKNIDEKEKMKSTESKFVEITKSEGLFDKCKENTTISKPHKDHNPEKRDVNSGNEDGISKTLQKENVLFKHEKEDCVSLNEKDEDTSKNLARGGETKNPEIISNSKTTPEKEDNTNNNTQENFRRNARHSFSSDRFQTNSVILNIEKCKTINDFPVLNLGSPENDNQPKTQPAVKQEISFGTADVACPKDDGVNGSTNGDKTQQTIRPNKINKMVKDNIIEDKCKEIAKAENPLDKSSVDTTLIASKKPKKMETDYVCEIPAKIRRCTRSSSASDSSKTNPDLVNIEQKDKRANKDVLYSDSPQNLKQNGQSLNMKQTCDPQPAIKKRRGLEKDAESFNTSIDSSNASSVVACKQAVNSLHPTQSLVAQPSAKRRRCNTSNHKGTDISSEVENTITETKQEIQIGSDIKAQLKNDSLDKFSGKKINLPSKKKEKSINIRKKPKSKLNPKNAVKSLDTICNKPNEQQTNKCEKNVGGKADKLLDASESNTQSETQTHLDITVDQPSVESSFVTLVNKQSVIQITSQKTADTMGSVTEPEKNPLGLLAKAKQEVKEGMKQALKSSSGTNRKTYLKERRKNYVKKKTEEPTTPEPYPESLPKEELLEANAEGDTKEEVPLVAEPPLTPKASSVKGSYSNPYAKVYVHLKHRYMRDLGLTPGCCTSEKVKVEEGGSDERNDEVYHTPLKRIKLPKIITLQAPPLCSFEDVLPILDPVSTSKTTEQAANPSPHAPVVPVTDTAAVSVADTADSSQDFSGFSKASPPLSPSMVFPDTPRRHSDVSELHLGANNNTLINEEEYNKIVIQITEEVTRRVEESLSLRFVTQITEEVTRRVEESLLLRFQELEQRTSNILPKTTANNSHTVLSL